MAFRSKLDGLQQAKRTWVCGACRKHHDSKPGSCQYCGSRLIHYFASKAELSRWNELCLLQRFGKISNLELQPPYPVRVGTDGNLTTYGNGVEVFRYLADFRYQDENGRTVVEDVKGSDKNLTEVFKLKRRIIEAAYGITIDIV